MKNKFILITLFISIFLLLFSIKSLLIHYDENVIYSEKVILEYRPNSLPDNYVNREDAVNRTLQVLKNGFLITLDREKVYEDIDLYKNNIDGLMVWGINFIDRNEGDKAKEYYCQMVVETGEILSIERRYFSEYETSINDNLNDIKLDKVKDIIKPLTDELDIEVREENMHISYSYSGGIRLKLFGDKLSKQYFEFVVDYENDDIISFYRVVL